MEKNRCRRHPFALFYEYSCRTTVNGYVAIVGFINKLPFFGLRVHSENSVCARKGSKSERLVKLKASKYSISYNKYFWYHIAYMYIELDEQ